MKVINKDHFIQFLETVPMFIINAQVLFLDILDDDRQ